MAMACEINCYIFIFLDLCKSFLYISISLCPARAIHCATAVAVAVAVAVRPNNDKIESVYSGLCLAKYANTKKYMKINCQRKRHAAQIGFYLASGC